LGKGAVYSGKNVVQTQSYGAEARGSAAKSDVIISDGKIGFPGVRKCDILVTMSQTALNKNLGDLKEEGILLIDICTVKNIPEIKAKVIRISATETAKEAFGASIYANMIVLGTLTKLINKVNKKAMEKAIRESVPQKTVEANIIAFRKGLYFVTC